MKTMNELAERAYAFTQEMPQDTISAIHIFRETQEIGATVYAMKNNIENGIYIPDDTRRLFTPTIVYTKNLIIWQRFTKKE